MIREKMKYALLNNLSSPHKARRSLQTVDLRERENIQWCLTDEGMGIYLDSK